MNAREFDIMVDISALSENVAAVDTSPFHEPRIVSEKVHMVTEGLKSTGLTPSCPSTCCRRDFPKTPYGVTDTVSPQEDIRAPVSSIIIAQRNPAYNKAGDSFFTIIIIAPKIVFDSILLYFFKFFK